MKERSITLSKFVTGLRKYSNSPINTETLVECFNIIPDNAGLIPSPTITQSINAVSVDHPFPQVFIGHVHWVCCTRSKIYTINADWTLTLQLDLNVYYNSFPNAPQGTWHFADFFDYVVLTNGGVTVIYNPVDLRWEYNDGVKIPTLGTVLNFNGQLIGSGRDQIVGDPKTVFGECSSNFLLWGKIGYADFTTDKSNVAGYRPMPWYGEIYKCLQLGDKIAVYGSGGIAIVGFDEVNTKLIKNLDIGIASREAVAGDKKQHVFVDKKGNFRILKASLEHPDPIYNEFFSTMLGREIVVTHDSTEGRFYITDGVRSFVLTNSGLGEIAQAPTTLFDNIGGVFRGFYTNLNSSYGYITTDTVDLGSRGGKTIESIEVGASATAAIQVAVEFRNTKTEVFKSTSWVTTNPNGVATIPISGIEFKFKVRCLNYSDFKLNYITIHLKFDDKRFVRGLTNADKVAARAGE